MRMTVLDYIEERTSMIPDSTIPSSFLHAKLITISDGVFTFETAEDETFYYEDEDSSTVEKGSYPVLEVTAEVDSDEKQFILISPDNEGWYFFISLEDYLEESFNDLDSMSYDYEVENYENF